MTKINNYLMRCAYLGMCGVMLAVIGTSVTAKMNPREKLMRAVQPNNTAR